MRINKKVVIGVIIAMIAIPLLVNVVVRPGYKEKSSSDAISKSTAEDICHTEANLKVQGREINVVSSDNYNPQFTVSGDTATLSWNGKSKDGSDAPAFVCELKGTNDKPEIVLLQLGSERLE